MVKNIEKLSSLDKAVGIIGKKFDLLIIDSIHRNNGRCRFNHLLKEIPSINPRILSMRLKALEQNKLIEKHLILGTPVKTEYSLTKKTDSLVEIIEKLKQWAESN